MKSIAYQYLERSQTSVHTDGSFFPLSIVVEDKDCLEAAQTWINHTGKPVCVLNMANQNLVGGDYLTSSRGQEESLIRRTNLLESLLTLPGIKHSLNCNPYQYDLPHRLHLGSQESGMGELTCIFSEGIQVNGLKPEDPKAFDPFTINIISSAAYNLAYSHHIDERLYLIGTALKIINQLRVAKHHGQRHLILGAFGCGAYANQPDLIAKLYHAVIYEFEFQGCFDVIVFSILTSESDTNNYTAFQQQFRSPPPMLYDILNEAAGINGMYSNIIAMPQLSSMMEAFTSIKSPFELSYLAKRLIEREMTFLNKNESDISKNKLSYYRSIIVALNENPKNSYEIIKDILEQKTLEKHCSSRFLKIVPYLVEKFRGLIKRYDTPTLIALNTPLKEEHSVFC